MEINDGQNHLESCKEMTNKKVKTSIGKHALKWSAFMMVRNEEGMVADVISCIRNQTVPPTRIHVLNDGSIDSTGQILESMEDVIVTYVLPHPPQHSDLPYIVRRHKLMRKAAKGMDYVLHMDADTEIPPDYMERITRRMRLDNVAVACGTDPTIIKTSPIEPGMVIDVKWLNTHPTLPMYALSFLAAESVIDGHPSVAYTTVPLQYKRPFGTHYSPDVWKLRGSHRRMQGLSFWWVLWVFRYNHHFSFLQGYISYKGKKLSKQHGQYANRLFVAFAKKKFGLKQKILLKTDVGLFILPKDYAKSHSLPLQ